MTDTGLPDDRMEEPPELGADIRALLGDPEMWGEPAEGVSDRIVAAIESEAAPFEPLASPPSPESRRRSWPSALLGAAASLVVLFGAVVVFSILDDSGGNEVLALELTPTGLVNDASGSVEMEQTDSGVRIELQIVGLPRRIDGVYYEAWLQTAFGELIPVGTFHDGADVVLWGGVLLAEVEAFTITQEGIEGFDDSGAASSGSVVLKADVRADELGS